MREAATIVVCLLAAVCVGASPVRATIGAPATVDGPSGDIVDFGGVAMAPDGTGGLVYRRRVEGRPHVFVAQLVDGAFRPPQRVDVDQRFDSSFPVIAAGSGGRLVAAWVQEFGEGSDRMFSAALDPGAKRFQAPVPVDLNVGEATATFPSVAMNAGGQAYVTYLVTSDGGGAVPPGYVNAELRVARYSGALWSSFGFPLNRNPSSPVRQPTAGSGPKVAIDVSGNGLLGWQEPDDTFTDRIYARRLFGSTPGLVLGVSPGEWERQPLRGPADQFSLDLAGFGQGIIAWRQQPGPSGALKGTRIMTALLPETFVDAAATFGAPRIVDGAGAGGPSFPTGPASAATAPGGDFEAVFGLGAQSLGVGGDQAAVAAPARLDDGSSSVPGDPRIDLARSSAAVSAWRVRTGARGGMAVSERRADGVAEERTVSAARGGLVSDFALAGSGLGDGLVGFAQGSGAFAQIGVVVVDAPPDPFTVQAPLEFVRARSVEIEWDTPAHAIGGVRYSVTVDDDTVGENLTGTKLVLPASATDDGVSVVQVIATDAGGQETTSFPAQLQVDRTRPTARIARAGRRAATVRIADGRKGQVAGVRADSVRVTWGDRRSSKGRTRLRHAYRRPGRYRVTVRVRDKAGNAATVRRSVVIR